jgi:hypothetical protein
MGTFLSVPQQEFGRYGSGQAALLDAGYDDRARRDKKHPERTEKR